MRAAGNPYWTLVGNMIGIWLLGRLKMKRDDDIKTDLKEVDGQDEW
jgi:hypothetical protein